MIRSRSIEWGSVNSQIREIIERKMGNVRNNLISQKQMWDNLLEGNWWIDYFLQCDMYQKENWIDFESEISRVIQSIDQDMHNDKLDENAIIYKFSESYLADRFLDNMEQLVQERYGQAYEEMKKVEEAQGEKWGAAKESEYLSKFEEDHPFENLKEKITYKKLITKLENDLDRLIRALEVYLAEYVGDITKNKKDMGSSSFNYNPDHVLSFNYSDTFEWIYGKGKKIEYDYIHGKADINNTTESNNMVLGIDEYLEPERVDKEIDFIAFKKYYQRIYKGTGCKYRDWFYEIQESAKSTETKLRPAYPIQIPLIKFSNNEKHKLFIFGHSLDVTDKDILRDLILNDNVYTEIYCVDKKDLKRKISNLVKVIGPDELVRRTGGSTKTIEFKLQ